MEKPNLAFFVGGGHSRRMRRKVTLVNTYNETIKLHKAQMQTREEKHFKVGH